MQSVLIEKQVFLNAKSVGSHRTFADVQLVRCEFTGSNLSKFDDPAMNLIVRDVTMTRCVAKRSSMAGVRFDNVLVDGLSASDGVMLDGSTFRHVTVRGRIGPVMVIPPPFSISQELQDAFTASIVRYYQDVDWALDISEAEFESVDLYFVPGDLIKRDPETQYLLRRKQLCRRRPQRVAAASAHSGRTIRIHPIRQHCRGRSEAIQDVLGDEDGTRRVRMHRLAE